MTVRRWLLAVVLAGAGVACTAPGDDVVAVANGDEVRYRDVRVYLADDVVPKDAFALMLTQVTYETVLRELAATELGVIVDGAEVQARVDAGVADIGGPEVARARLQEQGLTPAFLQLQTRLNVLVEQVGAELGENPGPWAIDHLERAVVEVDPRYGTWELTPRGPQVVAPQP